ncbi:hypothetical protein ASF22_22525 [Methylobacterium sp. Leaf87]|nr:hypothetical protein ASF22_22525 [Methylobacterium sp. Leaf87]
MRCGASLHSDEAGRQRLEELEDLRSSKFFLKHDIPTSIDAVHFEHVLVEVESMVIINAQEPDLTLSALKVRMNHTSKPIHPL